MFAGERDGAPKAQQKMQSSLASFFGSGGAPKVTEGSPVVQRGTEPELNDFPEGKIDVWSWNVNGVNATLDKGVLQEFLAKNKPTVLCLNETKIDIEKLDKKKLATKIAPGYAQYWNSCKIKKGYSGTAIFTRVKPVSVQFDFGSKHRDEGRSITMEFERFTLVATYVPNAGEGLRRLAFRT